MLWQAYVDATKVGCDPGKLAIDQSLLDHAGLGPESLEWLRKNNHVVDVTRRVVPRQRSNSNEPNGHANERTSPVALTPKGARLIKKIFKNPPGAAAGNQSSGVADSMQGLRPIWDPELRKLHVGNELVKHFRQPAVHQELIVTAFHEQHWPHRIDDPLPPQPGKNRKRHLRETIDNLNSHQASSLLHFHGDGTGHGVVWTITIRRQ